ncbi:MAG: lipopolysaccharide biosynthesis protein [Bacteroidales bacterium]
MNSNKLIARNLAYNSISFGINLLISFLFTPYLIKTVGKEVYGFYPLIDNFIGYSEIIVAAVGSMAGRFITMSYYGGKKEESVTYFNTVIFAYFGLSVLFTIVGIILLFFISDILTVPASFESDVRPLFLFGLLTLSIRLATTNFGIGTYVKNRIDLQSSRKAIQSILRVIFMLLLFTIFDTSIVYMSLAAFLSAIFGAIFDIRFKTKLLPDFQINFKKYFRWDCLFVLVSSGIWMAFNNLGNVLTMSLDLLLSNVYIGISETGDFSISKTIPTLLLSVGAMFASTFTPHFNILWAKGEKETLIREIRKSMILISILTSIPSGYLLINSDYFLSLWVPSMYSDDLCLLSIISVIPVVFGLCTNTLFDIFTITNKRKAPAIALFITGVIHLLISFILIKTTQLGVLGIAISGAITMSLRNIIFTPIYGARCLQVKWYTFYNVLIRCVLSNAVVALVSYLSRFFMSEVSWLSLFINVSFVMIMSVVINSYIVLSNTERTLILNSLKKYISNYLR